MAAPERQQAASGDILQHWLLTPPSGSVTGVSVREQGWFGTGLGGPCPESVSPGAVSPVLPTVAMT